MRREKLFDYACWSYAEPEFEFYEVLCLRLHEAEERQGKWNVYPRVSVFVFVCVFLCMCVFVRGLLMYIHGCIQIYDFISLI